MFKFQVEDGQVFARVVEREWLMLLLYLRRMTGRNSKSRSKIVLVFGN